jgi:hypothetical protein
MVGYINIGEILKYSHHFLFFCWILLFVKFRFQFSLKLIFSLLQIPYIERDIQRQTSCK